MDSFRRLLAQRHLAVLVCTAALLLKLLVPAGYMIDTDQGRFSILVCAGTVPAVAPTEMPAMHGAMADHGTSSDHGKSSEGHGKPELPCAFAGLSAAALGAIDPIQLAALIAFILAIALASVVLPTFAAAPYLRPPLRGPPAAF